MKPRILLLTAACAALSFTACDDANLGDESAAMAPHDESIGERTFELGSDTLEQYAAKCDKEIGVTVPDFNCDNGTEVPTTHFDGAKCDRPNRLNKECDPGSRFQVLSNTSSAFVVAHCRKHGGAPGKYGDIAVIQHNKLNGSTCWYQALDETFATLDGNVKAPSRGTAAWPWLSPAGTASIGCAGCHDNGPLIRSPYLTQVTGPNKLPGAGDSSFNSEWQPYRFVGRDFAAWDVFKVKVAGNTCVGCHRMGRNNVRTGQGTALDLGLRATATSEPAKNPHSADSPIWMTPGSIFYRLVNEQAATQIAACARAHRDRQPLPSGCSVTQYTSRSLVDGGLWRSGWCGHAGAQVLQGDFNSDGKDDFLCHDPPGAGSLGRNWVMVSNGTTFTDGGLWLDGWCSHAGSTLGTGDFDGDGDTDLYCKDPTNNSAGRTWIALSTGASFINKGLWLNNWCGHNGATFGTGKFNDDSRTDFWCHDPIYDGSTGRTWVALSTGTGFTGGGQWLGNWCSHSGATFGTGDFNTDALTDLWCHDPHDGGNGNTHVALSTGAGFTGAGIWRSNWCSQPGESFGIADFNGDGRTDLYCHDPMNGSKGDTWVALSNGASAFTDGSVWLGGWCGHNGASFGVGDFSGDGKSDIYCKDPMGGGSAGRTWVAVSTGSGFVDGRQWFPNWCSHAGATVGVGDFTGDGKSDLFCRDAAGQGGRTWVASSAP